MTDASLAMVVLVVAVIILVAALTASAGTTGDIPIPSSSPQTPPRPPAAG